MIDYSTWKLVNETASISKADWGYEISGSVAEVIALLQKCPQEKECIASVTFKTLAQNLAIHQQKLANKKTP